MDGATAGLIGVAIGGVVSLATALVTASATARAAEEQFARETEREKLEALQAVLDAAAVALEEVHWVLRGAVDSGEPHPPSTSSGDGNGRAWSEVSDRMRAASAEASRQGARLAIRLGVEHPCVAAYDSAQRQYRRLIEEILRSGPSAVAERSWAWRERLNTLGDEDEPRFLNQAKDLLRPRTV